MLYDAGRAPRRSRAARSVRATGIIEIGFTPAGDQVVLATGATSVLDVATGKLTDRRDRTVRHRSSGDPRPRRSRQRPDPAMVGRGRRARAIGPDDLELTDGAISPSGTRFVTARAAQGQRAAPTELALEAGPRHRLRPPPRSGGGTATTRSRRSRSTTTAP
jgi:hypothetical protein